MKGFAHLRDVTTLALDGEWCVGCGMCASVCPHGVFEVKNGKSRVSMRDVCMECGACARNCPVTAIRVVAGVGCATGLMQEWFERVSSSGAGGNAPDCC